MLNFTHILLIFFILFHTTKTEFNIKENFKKRNTIFRANDNFVTECYNSTIFKRINSLKHIVFISEYVFTGKISSVQSRRRGAEKSIRNIFKVYVRRVLKGNIGDLSDLLNIETISRNSSKRAYLLVEIESSQWKKYCSSSKGWPAILFGENFSSPLSLVINPVPLSIDRVRKVKTAIKGN